MLLHFSSPCVAREKMAHHEGMAVLGRDPQGHQGPGKVEDPEMQVIRNINKPLEVESDATNELPCSRNFT